MHIQKNMQNIIANFILLQWGWWYSQTFNIKLIKSWLFMCPNFGQVEYLGRLGVARGVWRLNYSKFVFSCT